MRSCMKSARTAGFALCGVGSGLLMAPSALAQSMLGPLPYTSVADSPLDTQAQDFVVITFEQGMFRIPGVSTSVPAAGVIGPGGLTDSVDADDGVIDGNGTNGHSLFSGSGSIGITFSFDAAVLGSLPTSVGIVWTDGEGSTSFEAFGADDVLLGTIGPVVIADSSVTGSTAEDRFFGVEHAAGIKKIRISNSAGGIEVDHFQFRAVIGCGGDPDINGDGHVDATDLALILGSWGGCASACCDADLNRDGEVDAADLALFLGAWTG